VNFKVKFPIWRLRNFTRIDNKLDTIFITTHYNTYILDDKSLDGDLAKRRLQLLSNPILETYPLYPLKDKINLLRILVKYPTGTYFIDSEGLIFKYKKSSKLNWVECKKIKSWNKVEGKTVFYVDKQRIPYVTDLKLDYIPYASIMYTETGPLIYDFTTEYHKPYKRKI
jgi:hypothetical protein